ncbi:type II toxin-antitoxin system RelE family toxin [Sporosarcina sp. YIM B06819]|uniref:type II toxin-antitoxin system RelE family toxin n=1 Tax=Sporosarcina sp. YIM B06819 TaxID=3081769 RepID=UPI00298CE19E|nr:type II toxin-antitoxin system RelE/ParE family toxin [Sporosarcina sp. YIM B06819]
MKKFDIIFIEEAKKDYKRLDGSEKKFVDIALAKMEQRADEIGEDLTNNLIGCRKIKFRKIGIRIVYRMIGNKTEIVEIIAIGKRKSNEVYENAFKRLKNNKNTFR